MNENDRDKEVRRLFKRQQQVLDEAEKKLGRATVLMTEVLNAKNEAKTIARQIGDLTVPVESTYEILGNNWIAFYFDRCIFFDTNISLGKTGEELEQASIFLKKNLNAINAVKSLRFSEGKKISINFQVTRKSDPVANLENLIGELIFCLDKTLIKLGYLKPVFNRYAPESEKN